MRDHVLPAAAMTYHPFPAYRAGALPFSNLLSQDSFFPALVFPEVASVPEPLSERAVPDAALRAPLGRQQPPAHPLSLKRLQADGEVADDPKVTLESKNLWKEFHKMGTEMVITKSGRQVNEETIR